MSENKPPPDAEMSATDGPVWSALREWMRGDGDLQEGVAAAVAFIVSRLELLERRVQELEDAQGNQNP